MLQLDKTEIVIRQRTTSELLDLSLVVIRRYWRPLMLSSALLGLPLLILNVALTSWMLGGTGRFAALDFSDPESATQWRFVLHMIALWYLEFPLASLPATLLIGNQIFFEKLNFRELLGRLRPILMRSIFVLGILRFGLVGIPLEFFVDSNVAFDPFVEIFLLVVLCCGWATFRRMFHPFAPEILGLEGCKLRVTSKSELSYWRRSSSLHLPIASDCFTRHFIGAIVVIGLVMSLYSLAFVGDFVALRKGNVQLFNALLSGQTLIQILLPLAMWLGGVYATVFRFLDYLDARIRLEGWEVELQLKAEQARLIELIGPLNAPSPAVPVAP